VELEPGTNLGRYKVIEKLDSGGMGVIYRAQDTQLDRDVALKFLSEHFAPDPGARRRFLAEARALARLNSIRICSIYGLEEYQGCPFIVMELLKGQTLAARLLNGTLPGEILLEVAFQITDALAEVHDHGIIHRDIKPSNIFFTNEGVIKLLDFGIAKISSSRLDVNTIADSTSTDSRQLIGTIMYMSPEQVLGKHVDTRSDLFSLGVVLYEMATGIQPFRRRDMPSTINAIVNTPLPLPSKLNSKQMEVMRNIVMKASEKDVRARFQSASEMRTLIELHRSRPRTRTHGVRGSEKLNTSSKHNARRVMLNPRDGMTYIWIEPRPGTASQGISANRGFWISESAITVQAFQAFVFAFGASMPKGPSFDADWKASLHPVVNVTWLEASDYCRWVEGRLLSEQEWEFCARADLPSDFPWPESYRISPRRGGLYLDQEFEGDLSLPGHHLIIPPSITLQGNITASVVTVLGTVVGDVCASDLLDIQEGGRVVGCATAGEVIVRQSGVLLGKVMKTGKLQLLSGSHLEGDIEVARIIIEDNAYFKGTPDIIRELLVPGRRVLLNPAGQPVGSAMVKTFGPNNYGLFDMPGLIGEWCSTYREQLIPPRRFRKSKIERKYCICGCCWNQYPLDCRFSTRRVGDASLRSDKIGFRCLIEE
jgi:serine/threonine protein kinase/cytoskeletal protein CcmA (bactofilin family)